MTCLQPVEPSQEGLGYAVAVPALMAPAAHVLRHPAINAVARLAGYPVAQTFAGHTPPHVTGRYFQATFTEVAAAIATLTGEPHRLAPTASRRCHRT